MRVFVGVAALVAAATACGGGGDDPPTGNNTVASVSLSPGATSQTLNQGSTLTLVATARNSAGTTMSGQSFAWTTSDAAKVSLSGTSGSSVTATGVAVGSSTVTVTSGTATKSVTINVPSTNQTFPATATVTTPGNNFDPVQVDIAQGGSVTWTFGPTTHNAKFTGAGAPSNIADCANCTNSRTFNTKGTFPYDCSLHAGMTGTVVVH